MDSIIDLEQRRRQRQGSVRQEQTEYLRTCQSRLNDVCDQVGRCIEQLHRLLEESHMLRSEMRRVQSALRADGVEPAGPERYAAPAEPRAPAGERGRERKRVPGLEG